jgi:hypothetical protein
MFPSGLNELVRWISFLLPGWLAIVITGVITIYGPSGELAIVFSSFLLSTLAYAIARAIFRGLRFRPRGQPAPGAEAAEAQTSEPPVWSLFAVAAVLGVLLGVGIENSFVYAGLRLLPFGLGGAKVGDGRPRTMALKDATENRLAYRIGGQRIAPAKAPNDGGDEQNYFRVRLADGPIYEGEIIHFELGEADTDIYMNPACLVVGTAVTPVQGPGAIIYEKNIQSIEIVDRAHSDCYALTAK